MKQKTHSLKLAGNVTALSAPFTGSQSPALPIASPPLLSSPSSGLPATIDPPSAAPAPPTPDRFLKIKIESLKAKQRADSFLNSLNSEQAHTLGKWMIELDSLTEVYNRVTAAPPDGLGLDVNFSTLSRLRDAWRAEDLATASSSMFNVVIDLEELSDLNQTARIQGAMNHLLHETAFHLMRDHPASPLLKELLANIQKLSDLDYKRQKLQLERDRLHCKFATPAPTQHNRTQHHTVDLNIVPPNLQPREPAIVVAAENEQPPLTI